MPHYHIEVRDTRNFLLYRLIAKTREEVERYINSGLEQRHGATPTFTGPHSNFKCHKPLSKYYWPANLKV